MNTLSGGPHAEYGDLAYRSLRAALSTVAGVPGERLIPGAGADELIRLVTTQSVGAGDAVVIPTPTFAMFAVEASLAGARVVTVERGDLAVRQPVEAIRAAAEESSARLGVALHSEQPDWRRVRDRGDPPPGRWARRARRGRRGVPRVRRADARSRAGHDSRRSQLQDELPNVLVLRSLSKALRAGGGPRRLPRGRRAAGRAIRRGAAAAVGGGAERGDRNRGTAQPRRGSGATGGGPRRA